jgi:hypothetical protein
LMFQQLVLSENTPQWASQFPTSRSSDDLTEPFRADSKRFVSALRAANATVMISESLRPPQRAYLMQRSHEKGLIRILSRR